jgi:hypothetical protein
MNYPGDVTAAIAADIESGRAMGPNYLGEHMWPVDAVFDPEKNATHVGFSLIPPAVQE